MSEASQDVGKQISFANLFNEFEHVQIPIIQRDYAQGRLGYAELRQEFLGALLDALRKNPDDPNLPLDLDFVYGSGFSDNGTGLKSAFAPLDGQQRLTTLFLLHWYLAWKDGETEDCKQRFLDERRSRFTYEVRPSSHDFFNGLLLNFPTESGDAITSVRELLEDKAWFFRSWIDDPTIESALTMLDDIHALFTKTDGYYRRLVDSAPPRITFQLLELKDFGLSDDLYIKMNARGKSLTSFETFKARLEQHLDNLLPGETRQLHGRRVTVSEYFSHRMDTAWTDLFWSHRDHKTNLFDDEVMRVVKAVALVSLDLENEEIIDTVNGVKALKPGFSFSRLSDLGCLNPRMLGILIAILDYWSGLSSGDWEKPESRTLDAQSAFFRVTNAEMTYPQLTEFAAFCSFVRIHQNAVNEEELNSWLRVVGNLVENTDIDHPSDYVDMLKSLRKLEPESNQILAYLRDENPVSGFNRQQVREEQIKAALMLSSEAWHEQVLAAERHGYFKGQIEFLLKFSGILDHWLAEKQIGWSKPEDDEKFASFSDYLLKAATVFDSDGLRTFSEFRWERALLTVGDYTLGFGKNNSFLQDKVKGNERRPTWKLLLRGHMTDTFHEQKRMCVKSVLDRINVKTLEASLDRIIDPDKVDTPWRKMLVESPLNIKYCAQRMFRVRDDGSIYLISKFRTSSDHVELWSYHLFHSMLQRMDSGGELGPFSVSYRSSNTEDYPPAAVLGWRNRLIEIDFEDHQFRFALQSGRGKRYQALKEKIEESWETTDDAGWTFWYSAANDIKINIVRLVGIANSLAS